MSILFAWLTTRISKYAAVLGLVAGVIVIALLWIANWKRKIIKQALTERENAIRSFVDKMGAKIRDADDRLRTDRERRKRLYDKYDRSRSETDSQ